MEVWWYRLYFFLACQFRHTILHSYLLIISSIPQSLVINYWTSSAFGPCHSLGCQAVEHLQIVI